MNRRRLRAAVDLVQMHSGGKPLESNGKWSEWSASMRRMSIDCRIVPKSATSFDASYCANPKQCGSANSPYSNSKVGLDFYAC